MDSLHKVATELPDPKLSVIVPVRNEGDYIEGLLTDLLHQDVPAGAVEIFVVDGRSTDGTVDHVLRLQRLYSHIRLLDNPRKRSSCARNIGINAARGDFVLFIDGHCRVPSRSMLRHVLQAFERGFDCLSRPQPLVASQDNLVARSIVLTRSFPLGHMPGSCIYKMTEKLVDPASAGCGYSRRLLRIMGGFREDFDAAEDVEFNVRVRRAGYRALHSSAFTVHYFARGSWAQLAHQMFRYGVGRARLWKAAPSEVSLADAAPAILPFMLCASVTLVLLNTSAVHLALILAPLLILAGSLFVIRIWSRCKGRTFLMCVLTEIIILVSGGVGSLCGMLAPMSASDQVSVRPRLRNSAFEQLPRGRAEADVGTRE